ncbi:MAG: hypothetical protein DRJ13_06050, partial [Bacteroidetes bacterium]
MKKFKLDGSDLKIIHQTEKIPFWTFSALDGLDTEIVQKIKNALLKLDKNNGKVNKILGFVNWKGFMETTGQELE